MTALDILENRTLSSFFVSVGTGLALESLFEPTSERIDTEREHDRYNVNHYKTHYFNVATLIRNIIVSVKETTMRNKLLNHRKAVDSILEILIDETSIMSELYKDAQCKPVFWCPDYTKFYRQASNIKSANDLSDYNKRVFLLTDEVMRKIRQRNEISYLKTDHRLPPSMDNTMITTHLSFDLLNAKHIPKLKLLESNTGRLKEKSAFNTKYHAMGKLPTDSFPYHEELLYFLGDSYLIKPVSIKLRAELYAFAIEKKWTPFTTRAKIREDLRRSGNIGAYIMNYTLSYM